MVQRCLNPRCRVYAEYGGRGITLCDSWRSFDGFIADMGTRPSPEHGLDRIDVNGPYAPWNCRWATLGVQSRNKRNSVVIDANELELVARWVRESETPGVIADLPALLERARATAA
jgi:hypothetical protein